MSNMEGKKFHKLHFVLVKGDQWVDVTTSELFDNKTVVVSHYRVRSRQLVHLLTYHVITNLRRFSKQYGVDDILVVSVNDTFVMNALERS